MCVCIFVVITAVYYSVVVEMSSSKGYTMKRTMLRRFRDFIRLHQGLVGLGMNDLPNPPPKLRLRAVNTSSALIEQRRRKLQEWLWSLVSKPRVAQAKPMALFLELEAHSVLLSEEEVSAEHARATAVMEGKKASEEGERLRVSETDAGAAGDAGKTRKEDEGVEGNVDRGEVDEDEEDAIREEKEEEEEGSAQRRQAQATVDPYGRAGSMRGSEDWEDEVDIATRYGDGGDMRERASGSRTSPSRSGGSSSTPDGGRSSASAVTVIPLERRETLNFLVSDVTKKANRAMEMLLRAEHERSFHILLHSRILTPRP